MKVTAETTYITDPDTVVALRLNPDFLTAMCRRTGAVEQEVSATAQPDGSGHSLTRRTMPTDDFPDVAKRFVGRTLVLVEEVRWSATSQPGTRSGTYEMRAEGAPVTYRADITIASTPTGSHEVMRGDITAKIPLVGGRIEKAIEPAVRAGLDAQAEAVQEWLHK